METLRSVDLAALLLAENRFGDTSGAPFAQAV